VDHVLQEVQAAHPNVEIAAYLDDWSVTGNAPDDVVAAARSLAEAMLRLGSRLNPTKTLFVGTSATVQGVTIREGTGVIEILGTSHSVDGNTEAEEQAVRQRMSESRFFSRLKECDLPLGSKMHVLRACGVPRINFALRTHPQEATDRTARTFDATVRDTFNHIVGHTCTDRQWLRASLPIRRGGCGLRSQHMVAQFAFRCVGVKNAQRTLTSAAEATLVKSFLATASSTETDELLAAAAPLASLPLTDTSVTLQDQAWRAYIKVRLGIAVLADGTTCRCGAAATNAHVLGCPSLSKSRIRRHDAVVSALASGMRRLGHDPRVEPSAAVEGMKRRPDIWVASSATDVVVTNPFGTRVVGYEPLVAAHRAAAEKQAQWGDWASARAVSFAPFAVEATGGLLPAARRWISSVVGSDESPFGDKGQLRAHLVLCAVVRALHQGNLGMFAAASGQ